MAGRTLYDKIWESHTVCILPTGQTQLFIGLHLIHEITTAPAFDMLREKGMDIAFAERTFATVDHIVPTDVRTRPFLDGEAEELTQALEKNVKQFGVEFFGLESANQGIVHVIGPQLGLTQPGMTLSCGDSHTSTHGAFGALAGATVFIGLPVARLRGLPRALQGFLNAFATGILVFLLWDILSHAGGPVEAAPIGRAERQQGGGVGMRGATGDSGCGWTISSSPLSEHQAQVKPPRVSMK